jgi:hypothetical protein
MKLPLGTYTQRVQNYAEPHSMQMLSPKMRNAPQQNGREQSCPPHITTLSKRNSPSARVD